MPRQDLRPAVLVCPEWWGLNDYPKHRADQLAKMGYIAFVADMYGKGVNTEDPGQAGAWATPLMTNSKADAATCLRRAQHIARSKIRRQNPRRGHRLLLWWNLRAGTGPRRCSAGGRGFIPWECKPERR